MKTVTAEVLSIGTELLLGEILDSNTQEIAVSLREMGINLYRTTSVGDNVDRIAEAAAVACSRADILITTGGLGPTVDDVTRDGLARAAGVGLVFHPDWWREIETRFAAFGRAPEANNRRQAELPEGAIGLSNPVGTAPGFYLDIGEALVISLPGVPAEMRLMFSAQVTPLLLQTFGERPPHLVRIVRTAGIGESDLEQFIADLEQQTNPTLGVAAHPGRVDLRLTASGDSEAASQALLVAVEAELLDRLGDHVYGIDDVSLESVVLEGMAERSWIVSTVEHGTGGALAAALEPHIPPFAGGWVLPGADSEQLAVHLEAHKAATGSQVALGLSIDRSGRRPRLRGITLADGAEPVDFDIGYPGPPASAAAWGISRLLDQTRRQLLLPRAQSNP